MRNIILVTCGFFMCLALGSAQAAQVAFSVNPVKQSSIYSWTKPDPVMQKKHKRVFNGVRTASLRKRNFEQWEQGQRTGQRVPFGGVHEPGSIVVSTKHRKLWYVLPGGEAIIYGVGVGRLGFTWGGKTRISRKAKWPGWTPPAEMRQRQPGLPKHMKGGPNNPLGARALYLGSSLYRIHGTNRAHTIGQAVSSGCIRMMNADVVDLYKRASVGATVYVYQ